MAPKKAERQIIKSSDLRKISVRGRYDAAQSTNENANLWSNVDALSAAQANSPSVRKVIRNRARYETSNNSYASGIVTTLANDVVGPKIQIQLGNSENQQKAEADFQRWAKATRLWSKLRTARRAKAVDGEAFAQLITNPLINSSIKLDILLIECDQIEGYFTAKDNEVDGIKFDKYQNPIQYRLLTAHPGDYRTFNMGKTAGTWIDAKYILHYFDEVRPGQVRGVSEIVAPLSLFGQLRAYTVAVLETARRAAEISGVMQTDLLPDNGVQGAASLEAGTIMDYERNTIIGLPEGYKYQGLKAEQPTTTYPEFKKELINETGRCLNMPANVANGDSSGYNYASGRLDHQTYDRSINIDRDGLEAQMLDRIYSAWLENYVVVEELSFTETQEITIPEWYYAGRGHVDPKKEADADNVRLKNGTLTKTTYYANQGKDAKRQEAIRIGELIDGEVAWNKARTAAGLEPAPYPNGLTDSEPAQPEDNNNE